MRFTIEEIKKYLNSQSSLENAILNISEESVGLLNPIDKSVTFIKNDSNLEIYENQIGLDCLINEQKSLYYKSDKKEGKYWLALNPRWFKDDSDKKAMNTEYEIYYWVNYGDDNTYGAFTVEKIKKWLTTPNLQLYTLGGTKER